MNPLDLRGPDFLRFYALCFVVAAVMVVAVTMLEDELFDGGGERLVAEMVRMLVGAARYIPPSE